jgi:hypothetical protein
LAFFLQFKKINTGIMASYRMMFRSGPSNWRQILFFNNIKLCEVFAGVKQVPFVADFYESMMKNFTSLPRKCPILAGKYSASTDIDIGDKQEEMNKTIDDFKDNIHIMLSYTGSILPNGIYRHVVKLYNQKDPTGLSFLWQTEIYVRLNDEVF